MLETAKRVIRHDPAVYKGILGRTNRIIGILFESGNQEDREKPHVSDQRSRHETAAAKRKLFGCRCVPFFTELWNRTHVTSDAGYAFPFANRNGVRVVSAWVIPEPDCFGARSRFRGHAAAP
jgi:hypothetical protein